MTNNEILDFSYHEFKTDSDNFVRDISKVLSLGSYSKEVAHEGEVIKPASASIEYSWQIVYPNPNFDLVGRKVSSFEELDSSEYELVTNDQINRMTNNAVIRCTTLTDDKESITQRAKNDLIEDKQKSVAQLYLQLYMPRFLCDTETDDPFVQEDGVTIPLCVNPKTGKKEAKVRNYHWCLLRLFDNPNENMSGPLENKTDLVTGELLEFNSASSEWSKLSWFTDFEDLFLSEIIPSTIEKNDKLLRVPVGSSLTNKTKIKVMANVHPNRVVLSVSGNPNVDYSDDRYLISTAYIGAIDSFKDAKKDIEGNFGIFTSSSSVPAIPNQTSVPTKTFHGLNEDEFGEPLDEKSKWMIYDQTPVKTKVNNSPEDQINVFMGIGVLPDININSLGPDGKIPGEMTYKFNYKKREIAANPLEDSEGGRTIIVQSSIKNTLGAISSSKDLSFSFMYTWGNDANHESADNNHVMVNIPISDLKSAIVPVKTEVLSVEGSLTEYVTTKIVLDDLYKYLYKYIEVELSAINQADAITPGMYTTQRIKLSGKRNTTKRHNGYGWVHENPVNVATNYCLLGFDEQGIIKKVVNKSERDKYGNLLKVNYPATFGEHTANGTTDFAMYKTDSADYWQSHFFMFSSSEQFMKKHMYGKSAYTNEYFADKIKITHSSEGVRGVLSGLILIDAESLFAFDELIVNKDFNKDIDKPEETYVYVPITASYCPFSNSPNERNGVGLLKSVKYNEYDDTSKCDAAVIELAEQYKDSLYYTNNKDIIFLPEISTNGCTIEWTSSDEEIIPVSSDDED